MQVITLQMTAMMSDIVLIMPVGIGAAPFDCVVAACIIWLKPCEISTPNAIAATILSSDHVTSKRTDHRRRIRIPIAPANKNPARSPDTQ